MSRNVDLSNQVFERWKVIDYSHSKNGRFYWNCECKCGTKRKVQAWCLTNGASKSCGCLTKEVNSKRGFKVVEMADKRFGKVLVKEFTRIGDDGRAYWKCICDCGVEFEILGSRLRENSKSCGCSTHDKYKDKRGPNNANWKGGRNIDNKGYVRVWDKDHSNKDANDYVLEHVKVMTEKLGRPLQDKENVHHKNGVRDDNRLDNLELWSSSQPPGQRVIDKLKWAKEIIALYDHPQYYQEDNNLPQTSIEESSSDFHS